MMHTSEISTWLSWYECEPWTSCAGLKSRSTKTACQKHILSHSTAGQYDLNCRIFFKQQLNKNEKKYET